MTYESPAAVPQNIPTRIGRFQIRARSNARTLGQVCQAYDPVLGREVVLIVPDPKWFRTEKDRAHLFAEIRTAAQLRHPNIAMVYEAGMDGNTYYIASASVAGQTLRERMSAEQINFERAAEIVMDLARALDYAHRQGVVHQGLCPDNIMLSEMGSPLIMDFGLARLEIEQKKLSGENVFSDSPANLAPEQIDEQLGSVGPASDQYALGTVLYELLCGKAPFWGPWASVIAMVASQSPPPPRNISPKVPLDLEAICLKAMSKYPSQRYGSCREMADDLRRYAAREPVRVRPLGPLGRLAHWRQRNPAVAFLSAVAILSALFAVAVSSCFGLVAARQAGVALDKERQAKESLEKEIKARQQEAEAQRQAHENRTRAAEQKEFAERQARLAEARRIEEEHAVRNQEEAITKKDLSEKQVRVAEQERIDAAEAVKEAKTRRQAEDAQRLVEDARWARERARGALKRAQKGEDAAEAGARLAEQKLLRARSPESRETASMESKTAQEQLVAARKKRLEAELHLKNAEQQGLEAAEATKETRTRQQLEDTGRPVEDGRRQVDDARRARDIARDALVEAQNEVKAAEKKAAEKEEDEWRPDEEVGQAELTREQLHHVRTKRDQAMQALTNAESILNSAEQALKNLTEAVAEKETSPEAAALAEKKWLEAKQALEGQRQAEDARRRADAEELLKDARRVRERARGAFKKAQSDVKDAEDQAKHRDAKARQRARDRGVKMQSGHPDERLERARKKRLEAEQALTSAEQEFKSASQAYTNLTEAAGEREGSETQAKPADEHKPETEPVPSKTKKAKDL